MRHIIRGEPDAGARQACEIALTSHQQKYGDYGPQRRRTNYVIAVGGRKFHIEVVNRRRSYVATPMTGFRQRQRIPSNRDLPDDAEN